MLDVIRAWHEARGNKRTKVIIPTPPTAPIRPPPPSAVTRWYRVVDGILSRDAVAAVMSNEVAALMITNPNTLGLFEADIRAIRALVHEQGAIYSDGANSIALMGTSRPAIWALMSAYFNLR